MIYPSTIAAIVATTPPEELAVALERHADPDDSFEMPEGAPGPLRDHVLTRHEDPADEFELHPDQAEALKAVE